jgi:hypothetical protein
MDLFTHAYQQRMKTALIGQEHIIGQGKTELREVIDHAIERRKLY